MSENTINIYMGAEDKVNVKDATQIILEDILLEFITAQANGLNLVKDDGIYEPYIRVSEGMVQISYLTTLPFQINDGEVQYMEEHFVLPCIGLHHR